MDNKQWFKNAKIGMMSHFGLYSLFDGDYRGKPCDEWVRRHFQIPYDEYHKLAEAFNPIYFDADEWIKVAKDAGMQYFVITSKHHDGFALFHSKVSKFNVVDATPFKRDIVGELAESCYKYNMKFGLYYSQDLDWDEPDGGGLKNEEGVRRWGKKDVRNNWDWPADRDYDFSRYFESKCKPQVKEILTQYGDLCLIWFDVPSTISREQCLELQSMVREYQSGCLINGRLGYGIGDYSTPGDNMIADRNDALCETVGTMNDSWGYRPTDVNYKTVEEIKAIKAKCAAIGSNYMLNIGPDPLGRIPAPAIKILEGLKS
jgi:alpha-L-fucosidase